MKRGALLVAVLMVVAACGDGGSETQVLDSGSTTTEPATMAPTATTVAPASTTATPSSTTAAPVLAEPVAIPRLESGLPATFVAVTEEWKAVEVDTATGTIVNSIGVGESPVESEDDGMVSSAIQQVWRTADQDWFIISQCCEPAAGMIYYLKPGEVLTPDNQFDTPHSFAWTVAPSPFDGRVIRSGYYMEIAPIEEEPSVSVPLDQPDGPGFATGVPAWDLTGRQISWVSNNWTAEGGATLVHLDLDDSTGAAREVDIPWIESGQWIDGIGTQASGNLVAFVHTDDPDPESSDIVATEGVVFDQDGALVATFDVETGSAWGGYEPSGRMLIYTDADNNVRWQGLGQSGILAEGFIHASW